MVVRKGKDKLMYQKKGGEAVLVSLQYDII